MDIEIIDEYGYQNDYSYLNEVINIALKEEKVNDAIFSIIFVDEEKIKKINKEYRFLDQVTDVISFAYEDNLKLSGLSFRILGEIFICIPRMQEQALTYSHSEKRELAFLTVHGILHLLGYDHIKKEEEKIMFQKQELILNEAGIKR